MNSITHNGISHDFATVDELLALPIVRAFTEDPAVSHLAQGDGCLVAYRLIDKTPVMCVVGRLAAHVVLPARITGLGQRKEVK